MYCVHLKEQPTDGEMAHKASLEVKNLDKRIEIETLIKDSEIALYALFTLFSVFQYIL